MYTDMSKHEHLLAKQFLINQIGHIKVSFEIGCYDVSAE